MSDGGVGGVSAGKIAGYLRNPARYRIETYDSLPSTNTLVLERARTGEPQWFVAAASGQSAGRGTGGRSFFSPHGAGVYFSVLLRPERPADAVSFITPAAAVAAAESVEELTGVKTGVKWVNDVYCAGKKVCGILTECVLGVSGRVEYAALGIGINITRPEGGMPAGLGDKAGYLYGGGGVSGDREAPEDMAEKLTAAVLERFADYYDDPGGGGLLDKYRSRSVVIGGDVDVMAPGGKYRARAVEIDDVYRLVVRRPDGMREALASGEVSVLRPAACGIPAGQWER
jgi:BirA family biotin operon repressor/biotin-[acetyl-CoA-carboxylase] ligase